MSLPNTNDAHVYTNSIYWYTPRRTLTAFPTPQAGLVLSHVNYYEEVDDHFYILSDLLPMEPFYVQIDGFLQSGRKTPQ